MAHDDADGRPFRYTFVTLGGLYIVAMGALLLAAGAGWTAPGWLGAETSVLVVGGGLLILAIVVPAAIFAMQRYAVVAAGHVHRLQEAAHAELHAAHASSLERLAAATAANAAMHEQDRERAAALSKRLDDQHGHIMDHALASEVAAWRDAQTSRHEALETSQEAHWVDHAHSHRVAEQRQADERRRLEAAIDQVRAAVTSLATSQETALKAVAKDWGARVAGIEAAHQAATKRSAERFDTLQETLRMHRTEMLARLDDWRAPDAQMQEWADRVNRRADHELAKFRHKIQHQLDQFEARAAGEIEAMARQGRDHAAMLAEDIMQRRLRDLSDAQAERAKALQSALDEQFAAFLAGQQARQLETEARLAAIGASRGVQVQGNEAFIITTHAPFGRVYPISDIEGIGNKTAYALQKMGILDTEHLWHADVPELAKRLELTTRQIRQWQSQAELMAIDGIGPQWGELLAASGVVSINHLANLHARELLELVQAHGHAYRNRLHKGVLTIAKAEDLIERARGHSPEAVVRV